MIIDDSIRKEFEILNDTDVIYFDNSATSLKPTCVVKTINDYYKYNCSNSGRGSYAWANKITKQIENTRKNVCEFLNAESKEEIIFTSGATFSSNMLAYSYGLKNLETSDEIMLCYEDHKSTVLPWINIKEILNTFGKNIVIKEILSDVHGDYKEQDLIDKVNSKTKLVILTHIHNVYGIENNIEYLIQEIKQKNPNTLVCLDASQSVGHIKVDVKELGCDFLYFSGHKMFAGNGVGVLYIKKSVQSLLNPYMIGGGFKGEKSVLNSINKEDRNIDYFENGTLDIPAILSLNSAINFINELEINEIGIRLFELTRYLYDKLKEIKEVIFDKGIDKCSCGLGFGIISFMIENVDSSEIGDILSDNNIYVRTGRHCTSNLNQSTIRVSLQIYNTFEEIDVFVDVLKNILIELKNY